MFEQATIQKKRSAGSRIVTLFARDREERRFGEYDRVKRWLLDLAAEKQCDRAVVVFIIGVVMNEFVQAWTDDQDGSPLDHRGQKQRDNLRTDRGGGTLSNAGLFGFWLLIHETFARSARGGRGVCTKM
jgi:hypothetical protein